MENIALQKANLTDLTTLWLRMSQTFQGYHSGTDFDYCSTWPNRLWFHEVPTLTTVLKAKKIITQTGLSFTIPYWDIYEENAQQILVQEGFEAYFSQLAMALQLTQTYALDSSFKLKKINSPIEAKQWTALVAQSFGHQIDPTIIFENRHKFTSYIAYYNNQAVGTGLTNTTGNNVGVHLIGIPPQHRRKGLAGLIMKALINIAVQEKRTSMTLQASDMGKGLYLKLGFEEQFLLTNYRLAKH